jgi:tRNA-splicing ligase RtcB
MTSRSEPHRAGAAAQPPPPQVGDEDAAIAALLSRLSEQKKRGVTRVGPLEFELALDWAPGQRVPARFFASRALLELLVDEASAAEGGCVALLWRCVHVRKTASQRRALTAHARALRSFISALQQLANVATLPGIVGASLGMPDIHSGYGFAIGNVAAFDLASRDAIVSPGGVGFDINCGVRLLRSALTAHDLNRPGVLARLADALYKAVPAGTGASERALALDATKLTRVLNEGMGFLEAAGLCWREDRDATEERGCCAGADASKVSARAKARGDGQAGTLGAGNHYLEVQIVEHVYDEAAAAVMGLRKDGVCVMLHTGSRGLGHQVCTDYLQRMDAIAAAQKIPLVDRQLACVRADSSEGRDYLAAMRAAANFAFVNRSALAADVRAVFADVFGGNARTQLEMHQVYDVAHNVAKVETHTLPDGSRRRLLVHRKGATRAFPPGHPDVPAK